MKRPQNEVAAEQDAAEKASDGKRKEEKMYPGNVSQTVWRRSVIKQLHKAAQPAFLEISEPEMCMAIPAEPGTLVVTADGSACGSTTRIGYYGAVRAVNDLMTRGAEPVGLQVRLSFPTTAEEADVREAVREVQGFCEDEKILLGGIRTEVIPALGQTMARVTAMGSVEEDRLLSPKRVVPGQDIILCGSLALEGMERILDECGEELRRRFVPGFLRQMEALRGELSQTKALRAVRGHVSAMQQIGNGGILAALWEVAERAGIGLRVELPKMTICQETIEVCEFYRLNPYQMTSAGGILMFTDEGERLLEILRGCGARAARLGSTTAETARVITSGEEMRFLDRPAPDELAVWQEKKIMRS